MYINVYSSISNYISPIFHITGQIAQLPKPAINKKLISHFINKLSIAYTVVQGSPIAAYIAGPQVDGLVADSGVGGSDRCRGLGSALLEFAAGLRAVGHLEVYGALCFPLHIKAIGKGNTP